MYNGSITIEETRGKYIFWDIDGTLAPFRFNGHILDPLGTRHGMSLQEIEEGCFLYREPSKHMQRVVAQCEAKEHLVMGHCHAQKEIDDKHLWIDKYFPMIQTRYLVADEVSKCEMILKHCKEQKIDLKDVVFVDDKINILQEAEENGIAAYHISSFLDWFEG